ncbi:MULTISPECIES: bifunctional prephenate dehydrogenase/3-phosphoshikimate 1-carboxyvinyltransferase [unclassified Moraxella]|uniref:bifunctional prephenate dehydrogenase/3-phosphoshikimate 1-carboxyvinyltransferase n=1 Tax=unclassified Moraxella TaxID=2685852 RepID=UPI003AF9D2DA
MFQKVCFIGLGLIGASLAQAMRDQGLAKQIVAVSRSQTTIDKGIAYGLLDAGYPTAIEGAKGADLIVLATPVQAIKGILEQIKDVITPNTIITDVGSTKGNIVADAIAVFGEMPTGFIPAHPIAGAEKSGIDARNAKLFANHKVIITPLPNANPQAVSQVTELWQRTGAEVISMTPQHHDNVLARTSHLPHLLAFNLVDQLSAHDDNMDIFRFAAGGFRDFTRIAASDPTMWHDIFYANKTALLGSIDDFSRHLANLRAMIETDDSQAILGLLTNARHARQHFGHMLNKTAYLEQQTMTQTYIITPSQQFTGSHTVAGDKSISHRSIMLGSLADGVTHVTGFLEGEDALATLQAFRDMGVNITDPKNGEVTIHGVGIDGLKPAKNALYMGNSGTSMRLLSGILSAQKFDSVMTGDPSLSKRPMERVAKPLREMGAKVQTTGEKGTPPISITGNQALQGITYEMPMASAQVKSCLLLAGLWANGKTTVIEPEVTRDHTERMLTAFGYPVEKEGNAISIVGSGRLTACDIAVPADISSSAFFMVAGAIAKQGNVTIKQVGINPTRTGVIDILKLMGADLTLTNEAIVGGEPVADIVVKSSKLKGIEIPEHLVPLAIDEFPVLFIASACATGKTVLHGAEELRVKESDRIQVMADGLKTLGIDCTVLDDGIEIIGKGDIDHVFGGGEIECHHDHRIAMSFTVASLRASDTITIHGTETVNTSFPNFAELVNSAGLKVAVVGE